MSETSWGDIDPVRAAAQASAPERLKRFYDVVALEPQADGVALTLDGRPARTPGKRPLVMPVGALADAVAEEWRAQVEFIDPTAMPATRVANTTIDGVADNMADVRDEILKYAQSDLICYRADKPEALCNRQTEAWDPVIEWIERTFGEKPVLAGGIVHVEQPHGLIDVIAGSRLGELDPFTLNGLYTVTVLTGSAFLALAVHASFLDPCTAWSAAHVDEDWQIEQWGDDEIASARRAAYRQEFDAAVLCLPGHV